MASLESLDPFQPHLHLLPDPGSGIPIEWGILTSITRSIDLVKNSHYFASFIRKYRSEISSSEDALLSVLGSSIANMLCKREDFDKIVVYLCEQYDNLLGRTALNNVDVGNMLGFIRDFYQVGYNTRIIVPCFLARLHLIKASDNIRDVKNVIKNNLDVLEMLYADEDMQNYAHEISQATDRIFSLKLR